MKNYLLVFISLGFMCAAISTPIHTMETNRIKNAFSLPIRFISNNLYPLAFWGTVGLIGAYTAKKLFNYWKDRERTYEIDEMTKIVISSWPVDFPEEFSAVIKNRITNENYGQLIYQVQEAGVIYIRKIVIEQVYREKKYGSKLLKTMLDKVPSLHGCTKVIVFASPIGLKSGETKQELLPKLIAFYQKQGAQIDELKTDGAWMKFDLTKQA